MARRLSLPEPFTDESLDGGGAPGHGAGTEPEPAVGGDSDDGAGESALAPRRPGGWRRLRAGKKDQDVLARLRDGLAALADDGEPPGQSLTTLGHPAPEGSPPWEPAPEPSADAPDAAAGQDDPEGVVPGYADSGWSEALAAEDVPAGAGTEDAEEAGGDGPGLAEAAGPAGEPGLAAGAGLSEETGLAEETGPAGPPMRADGADAAIAAMRAAFARVEAAGNGATSYFYGWLFTRNPELRSLFPAAMNEQRDRLLAALTRIVASPATSGEMTSYLARLGRDHRKYAVTPQMYDMVNEALVATLRAVAGPAFTPAAEEAWGQTYTAAAAQMIAAAEADSRGPACWTAEVVDHQTPADGIAVLTVAPDRPLRYQAGQHLSVQTPRWPRVWRPYSIAGRPREDGLIRFHVKAVPGGWVSNALVYHTGPGDELTIGPAMGTMTLPATGDRDLLCVAGGTGLSPVKAITEEAIHAAGHGRRRRIYLFCGAQRRSDLYDLTDLWRLADAYDRLLLTPVTSDDPAFDGMQGNVGWVAARYLPHPDCEAYVAGPAAMVRESIQALGKAGLPRERIHFDDDLLAGRGT